MPDTFSANTKIRLLAFDDLSWDTLVNANSNLIDSLSPVGALCVTAKEVPSTSLNVSVAAGKYQKLDGTVGTYAGTTSQAVTTSATRVLYLTPTGTLTVAASYPSTAHVRLATVIAGATTITSVTDDRTPAPMVNKVLANAVNDAAAATAGVGVGELYRNGSVVMQRIS